MSHRVVPLLPGVVTKVALLAPRLPARVNVTFVAVPSFAAACAALQRWGWGNFHHVILQSKHGSVDDSHGKRWSM
jgi:hypothetical protein